MNTMKTLKHQLFNDAFKQKHSIEYFLNNSYTKENLIIFDNQAVPDKMSFFRELLYFYEGSSTMNFVDIEKYTLCFWIANNECFCGIYDTFLQKILNSILITDNNKIGKIKSYTYIN